MPPKRCVIRDVSTWRLWDLASPAQFHALHAAHSADSKWRRMLQFQLEIGAFAATFHRHRTSNRRNLATICRLLSATHASRPTSHFSYFFICIFAVTIARWKPEGVQRVHTSAKFKRNYWIFIYLDTCVRSRHYYVRLVWRTISLLMFCSQRLDWYNKTQKLIMYKLLTGEMGKSVNFWQGYSTKNKRVPFLRHGVHVNYYIESRIEN